jgi:UDP-N-acetylglucosamine 4-epimerase
MNILVTGGAGFIGSHIVEHLLQNPMEFNKIRILDNLSTGKIENIQSLLKNDNVEFMYGDITNLEICRKAVDNINIICHQAALGSVPLSLEDPLMSHNINVSGFLNILIAAKEKNIKRIVYASSSAVYGDDTLIPKQEDSIGNLLSPYAVTKYMDEMYANIFTRCYNMECIGLRYFNVYGPRQNPNGPYAAVIPKFIDIMKNGKSPIIYGDGTATRDYVHVKDVANANYLALTTNNKDSSGKVFNIGGLNKINLIELVNIINKKLNTTINPVFSDKRIGDIEHSSASIELAQVVLNYTPMRYFLSDNI